MDTKEDILDALEGIMHVCNSVDSILLIIMNILHCDCRHLPRSLAGTGLPVPWQWLPLPLALPDGWQGQGAGSACVAVVYGTVRYCASTVLCTVVVPGPVFISNRPSGI